MNVATIHDVAKAAGVSAMTVSNVINDHPNVRKATRQKVLEAMARLDYRVNVAARNLRKGRTGTIGLAVPEVNRLYYGRLAAAIITAAERHGLRVGIEQTGALRENELEALSLSRNRLYDGLILSTVGMGPADVEWLKVDYPVVIMGERIFGGPVDHVAMPNVDASQAATRHLIERGCRRIAIVCGAVAEDVDVSSLRHSGYRLALESAGLPVDPGLVRCVETLTMPAGARCAREMAESGLDFDGVFCVTDTVAMGVLRGLADAGVRVPEQVKVIGFDNVEESEFLVPSLSTIDPDHDMMAERAVGLLTTRIDQAEPRADRQEFVSRFSLVARESTGG
ncbi:LacI family DNA-binding transcriptional regulator [Streptomyces sp. ME19-01-6]|uniref:LacI family DNA-binding transcriptional regulator n=1 Tax=Streptomyces sp. ME19-01-6 TaxID=3028686 RepID=UPI0029B63DD2|nr:LacI family DNA-binding transcriptional regulator [Streptomyces sp. ME19-01-6]MDX3224934.1 LacI family DNA-binding transcriptional regulator [Streptomyces sp. ME19-01-6]